jgi:hypothetical protein
VVAHAVTLLVSVGSTPTVTSRERPEMPATPNTRIRTRVMALLCPVLATGAVAGAHLLDMRFNPGGNGDAR